MDTNMVPHWQERGACNPYPPDWFFPPKGGSKRQREALAVCNTKCTVREQCLDWILDQEKHGVPHGIFGGMTTTQRRALKRCALRGCKELVNRERKEGFSYYCSDKHLEEAKVIQNHYATRKYSGTLNDGDYYMKGTIRG